MIVAAEATGELDAILDQLARYLERAEATSRRLRQAMLYPGIVLALAAVVIAILTTVVLPSFVTLFADFEAELPLTTQIMLAVGAFGGSYGIQTVAIVVGRRPAPVARPEYQARPAASASAWSCTSPSSVASSSSGRRPDSPARSGSCFAPACPSPAPSTSR